MILASMLMTPLLVAVPIRTPEDDTINRITIKKSVEVVPNGEPMIVEFSPFDPSRGTLLAIEVRTTMMANFNFKLENTGTTPLVGRASYAMQLRVDHKMPQGDFVEMNRIEATSKGREVILGPYDGATDYEGKSGRTVTFRTNEAKTTKTEIGAVLQRAKAGQPFALRIRLDTQEKWKGYNGVDTVPAERKFDGSTFVHFAFVYVYQRKSSS
jgi:hypothetical protein